MKRYSEEHQWIDVAEDGTATVGITKFAADELGEITFIEMPATGKKLAAGDQLCVIESLKAASDVFMPAAGTITAVNGELETAPEALNNDPEGAGWICRLENVPAEEVAKLMDQSQYLAFIGK